MPGSDDGVQWTHVAYLTNICRVLASKKSSRFPASLPRPAASMPRPSGSNPCQMIAFYWWYYLKSSNTLLPISITCYDSAYLTSISRIIVHNWIAEKMVRSRERIKRLRKLLLVAVGLRACKYGTRRTRSCWKRIWNREHNQHGVYPNLLESLKNHDAAAYRNYLRVTEEQFQEILASISSHIKKEDTVFQQAISPAERLPSSCYSTILGIRWKFFIFVISIPHWKINNIWNRKWCVQSDLLHSSANISQSSYRDKRVACNCRRFWKLVELSSVHWSCWWEACCCGITGTLWFWLS